MGFTRLTPSKPTIAAISGFALAGGLELALWCDLRIATEGSTLGYPERRWGVPLIDGGTQRLPRIVGLGRALDLILTGRMIDAGEALAMGMLTEVVAPGAHLDRALELAEGLGALPAAHDAGRSQSGDRRLRAAARSTRLRSRRGPAPRYLRKARAAPRASPPARAAAAPGPAPSKTSPATNAGLALRGRLCARWPTSSQERPASSASAWSSSCSTNARARCTCSCARAHSSASRT